MYKGYNGYNGASKHGHTWSTKDKLRLNVLHNQGFSDKYIAKVLGRTLFAIECMLEKTESYVYLVRELQEFFKSEDKEEVSMFGSKKSGKVVECVGSVQSKVDSERKRQADGYPMLKESKTSGVIVLFESHDCGTVVSGTSLRGNKVGFYAEDWDDPSFSSFHGTIELKGI